MSAPTYRSMASKPCMSVNVQRMLHSLVLKPLEKLGLQDLEPNVLQHTTFSKKQAAGCMVSLIIKLITGKHSKTNSKMKGKQYFCCKEFRKNSISLTEG